MSIQKLDSRHEAILQEIEAFKELNAQYTGVHPVLAFKSCEDRTA
jgi:hypothetical protein